MMIIRPEQHWFLRLFDWHGSVLSKIIFRLLLNVLDVDHRHYQLSMVRTAGDPLNRGAVQPAGDCDCDFPRLSQQRQLQPLRRGAKSVGTVLIAERTLVRQLRNILPAEHDAHRRIVSYLVAFSWSLKHQLRKTEPTADLRRLLPEERVTEILASSMPTNRILLLAGNEIGQLRKAGKLSDITLRADGQQTRRAGARAGGCESWPPPRCLSPIP